MKNKPRVSEDVYTEQNSKDEAVSVLEYFNAISFRKDDEITEKELKCRKALLKRARLFTKTGDVRYL